MKGKVRLTYLKTDIEIMIAKGDNKPGVKEIFEI